MKFIKINLQTYLNVKREQVDRMRVLCKWICRYKNINDIDGINYNFYRMCSKSIEVCQYDICYTGDIMQPTLTPERF